jgi:RNA polymerase sigma-70 factor, ECF subfamily
MIPSIEIFLLIFSITKLDHSNLADLSRAIREGDRTAFKNFYDLNYAPLYRFLLGRGIRHDEAEDLIQKAFILIWEKRETIDESKSLKAFLFQIAYRQMLNHLEYQSKFKDEDLQDMEMITKNPVDDIDYPQLLNFVKKVILQMPEKRRMVFELCFMEQFTYKEAADALEISVKTVENHMALAFKDLRSAMIEYYGREIEQEL